MKLLFSLLFIAVGCFAQIAVLDNFSSGIRLNNQSAPLWSIFEGSAISASNNTLHFTGSHVSRTPYNVIAMTPTHSDPGGIGPFGANCAFPLNECILMQFDADFPWEQPQVGNLHLYAVFHNFSGTGTCTTFTTYVDQEGFAPTFSGIYKVDSTHFWFLFENVSPDFGACTVNYPIQVYDNCAKFCGIYMQFMPGNYSYPTGFMANYVMSGSFNGATMNHFTWKMKTDRSATIGILQTQVGEYIQDHSNTHVGDAGTHPESEFIANVWANRQYWVRNNRYTNHNTAPMEGVPEDYYFYGGSGVHWWDGMTRWYFSNGVASVIPSERDYWANANFEFNQFQFEVGDSGDPEGAIGTLIYGYSGNQPSVPTTGRYELGWVGTPNQYGSFEVRQSTSSMKANGFSTGAFESTIAFNGGNNEFYTFSSADLPEISTMYFGIRPKFEVGMAASGPSGDIIVTAGDTVFGMGSDMFIRTGDHVTVANVVGCTAANGSWTTTFLDRVAFPATNQTTNPWTDGTLSQVVVAGWTVAAGTLTSIVVVGTTATAHTSGGPSVSPGDIVTVYGTTDPFLSNGGAGTTYTVATTGAGIFTFTVSSSVTSGTYNTSTVNISNGSTTVTTTVSHGLSTGRLVRWVGSVLNTSPSVGTGQDFIITPILTVPDTTHLTFLWRKDASNGKPPAGTYPGGISGAGSIYAYSALQLNSSGNCNASFVPYTSGTLPTVVSTEDKANFLEIAIPSQSTAGGGASSGGKSTVGGKVIRQ